MVFKFNRIIPGLFLLIFIFFFYFIKIDIIFFFFIFSFVLFDLFKSNIINSHKLLITFLLILLISKFFFTDLTIYVLLILFLILLSFNNIKIFKELILFIILLYTLIIYDFLFLNRDIFFMIIFLSFFNDTCAYIFGNIFKGPIITPTISPNKTWSGTVLSTSISFFLLLYLNFNVYLSFFISISFFFGDLYFSFIKRKLNLKDFSNILIGHGGSLDRLDSMLFAFILYHFSIII